MSDTKKRVLVYTGVAILLSGLAYGGFVYSPDAGPATLVNSAEVLAQVGMFDEAIDHAKRALAQEPDNRYAHIILAYCLGQKGDFDRALGHYETAIELTGQDPDENLGLLRLYYAEMLCRAGRPEEGRAEAASVLEADPDQLQARLVLAGALRLQDQTAAAIEHYQALIEAAPSDPMPLVLWAEAERERENDAGASELLDRVLAMAPENAEFRMRKACVLAALGEEEAAVTEILRAAETKRGVARQWVEEAQDLAGLRDEPRLVAALEPTPASGEDE